MSSIRRFADELERDGNNTLRRAGQLLVMAKTLRELPATNAPTAEMRQLLGSLGFCVVSADALAYAERHMRDAEPIDDGLSIYGHGISDWDKALLAIQEALTATNHPRLESQR